jgi:hypothetical protein
VEKVRRLLVVLLLLIVSSSLVLAASTVTVTPIKNQVSPLEQAEFEVTIANNAAVTQRYTIYSFTQGWNVDPFPLKDKIISLPATQKYTTKILAQPTESFPAGIYYVSINIESDTGERYTEPLKVYLTPDKAIDYLPAITATIDMNDKINPRDPISIKLFLENRNPLDLSDLTIRIQSDIPEFSKEVIVDLPPLQKKTVEFAITPNVHQQPKDYILFFVFEKDGDTAKIIEKKIKFLPLLPEFSIEEETDTIFFKKFTKLSIHNDGNVLNSQEVKFAASFLQSLFTANVDSVKEGGQSYLMWTLELGPNETKDLQYVTNYRILFYILVLLIFGAGFYLYVVSPVALKKSVLTSKSDEDRAISSIKITLEVRNTSRRPLKNVQVIDVVPGIAHIEKSLQLGTLKPHEVKSTKKGTKVIWQLAELEGHEHRLITYKVRAKLNILGTFILPRATVEFTRRTGRKSKAYSNVFRLGQ